MNFMTYVTEWDISPLRKDVLLDGTDKENVRWWMTDKENVRWWMINEVTYSQFECTVSPFYTIELIVAVW